MPDVTGAGPTIADQLAAIGRRFHARGWVLGTSGNLSAVVSQHPLRLAITASSLDKGALDAAHILHVGEDGQVVSGTGRPSAETLLHVEIVRRRGACAVLHTHSVWGTMLSDAHAADGGLRIEGYEMLKGLDGVCTHEHREWVPIVENDQDMARLSGVIGDVLARHPEAHAVLLRRHGLYTWGKSLADALRHVEILEFLFETIGRTRTYSQLSGREGHHGTAQSS
ncbi:MAG TPA: methylthioribulose 1-phosphate dehydratase [Gemmatimonadaceae bacterium]|nr:methylthioribulose 1-phosphate dehydratase [Gemmatimonadaceae bacterium]